MGTIRIRMAELSDAQDLGRIMAISFRSAFAGFISRKTLDECAVEENCGGLFAQLLRVGEEKILLGSVNDAPMGLLVWTDRQDCAEILAIHSLPRSWGSGLGKAMLDTALEQIGDRTVQLWAFAENTRARRFYEKHGFCRDGSRRISEFDGAEEIRYVRPTFGTGAADLRY